MRVLGQTCPSTNKRSLLTEIICRASSKRVQGKCLLCGKKIAAERGRETLSDVNTFTETCVVCHTHFSLGSLS